MKKILSTTCTKHHTNRWHLFFSILLCVFISACANNGRELSINNGSIKITVPAELEVYEVDGKTLPLLSFNDGLYSIYVTPGQHSIAAQYVANWNTGNDGDTSAGRVVKWQPVVFNHTFNNDATYQIRFDKPLNFQEANTHKGNPKIFLYQDKQKLAQGEVLDTPSMMDALLSGRFRYGTPSTTIANSNVQHAPAREKNDSSSISTTDETLNSATLEQMKTWWNSATDEDKKAFWLWLSPNN